MPLVILNPIYIYIYIYIYCKLGVVNLKLGFAEKTSDSYYKLNVYTSELNHTGDCLNKVKAENGNTNLHSK
jgi:hypothetical protein